MDQISSFKATTYLLFVMASSKVIGLDFENRTKQIISPSSFISTYDVISKPINQLGI